MRAAVGGIRFPAAHLIALLGLLAACTSVPEDKPGTLPPLSPNATTATSRSPSASDADLDVKTARGFYTSYLRFLSHEWTVQSMPAAARKNELNRWMVDPQLSRSLTATEAARRRNYRTVGPYLPHILSLTVRGSQATINDCIDNSKVRTEDSRTGRVIAGSVGHGHFWAVTILAMTTSGWRVRDTYKKAKRCAYT